MTELPVGMMSGNGSRRKFTAMAAAFNVITNDLDAH
jgi:hypothetical protein